VIFGEVSQWSCKRGRRYAPCKKLP
jgi:hypothetical protein